MKRFEIRLEAALFREIELLAQTERRSVNQQIAVLLTHSLLTKEYQRVLPTKGAWSQGDNDANS